MKTLLTVAAVLGLTAIVPTLGDIGAVRASRNHQVILAEASGPSAGSRDTALYAETESSGPTRGSHDSSMVAEASQPSPGARDTALYAETESNGASPGGRDSAQV